MRTDDESVSVANTSMRAMRIALYLVWFLFLISSALDGSLVHDVWGWIAIFAGLGAAYLLTKSETGYTPFVAWATVALSIAASSVIVSFDEPAVDMWMYLFATILPGSQALRGDMRRGLISGVVIFLVGAWWVWSKNGTFNDYLAVLTLPIVSIGVIAFVQRQLGRFVRKEMLHRSQAEKARFEAQASADAAERSSRDLAEIQGLCGPLLQGLRDGETIDADVYVQLMLVEATIREMIRSPLLQHPVLNSTVLQLRRNGVSVLLLGEAVEGHTIEPIDESLASVLAARISTLQEGDSVTIRMLQGPTDAAVSLRVVEADVTTRVEFGSDGSVLTER